VAEPDGLPQKYLRDFSNQTGVRTVSIRRRELRKRSWDPCRLEASQPYVLQFAKEEPLLPWMEADDGGSVYLFCTCTAAFRRFLPIEPFVFSKTFENLHTAADRLPPPPPTRSNSFDNLRVFSCRSRRLQYFSICAPERGPTVPPSGGGFARFSRQFRDRV